MRLTTNLIAARRSTAVELSERLQEAECAKQLALKEADGMRDELAQKGAENAVLQSMLKKLGYDGPIGAKDLAQESLMGSDDSSSDSDSSD